MTETPFSAIKEEYFDPRLVAADKLLAKSAENPNRGLTSLMGSMALLGAALMVMLSVLMQPDPNARLGTAADLDPSLNQAETITATQAGPKTVPAGSEFQLSKSPN